MFHISKQRYFVLFMTFWIFTTGCNTEEPAIEGFDDSDTSSTVKDDVGCTCSSATCLDLGFGSGKMKAR